MTIYHIHHIVPRHMGGTDDPSNLIKLTVQEHANAHKLLYEQHKKWQDLVAYKALSGQINIDCARRLTVSNTLKDVPKTNDHKTKMSQSQKDYWASDKAKQRKQNHKQRIKACTSKKVIINGLLFNSQSLAAKHFNVSEGTITNWIYKGKAVRVR